MITSQGKLHEAVDSMLNLEKSSRLAEDITATKACCSAILSTCFEANDWKLLEEQITLLSKRRSQLKQVCALPACVPKHGSAMAHSVAFVDKCSVECHV